MKQTEKSRYLPPVVRVISFSPADILTTSAGFFGEEHCFLSEKDEEEPEL